MTTKSSQPTNESSQDAAELHRQIEALGKELQQKVAECNELRADIADILLMPCKEAVADLVHRQWTGWMKYLFSKCKLICGVVIIPRWAVERWQRQMATSFLELPPEERETDLTEAKKMISAFSVLPKETEHRLLAELTEERQQRIEANADLLATALALGLDANDIDNLPQKAAGLKWDYDEAMRQYDEAQKRACEAETRASEITRNALEANRRWKEKVDILTDLHKLTTRQAIKEVTELETAIKAGRKFWQEYATLADDLPDDMYGYFRRCNYLAGKFADALRKLEVDHEEENQQ